MEQELRSALLKNELVIFASDYGKKGVTETWAQRFKKQVKQLDQFKDFSNYNIATGGDSLIEDVDLDCPEALRLADAFLIPTGMEFGRESTGGRSHRLYKVIDLTKKDTRSYHEFDDVSKAVLVELRANLHYTMCLGQYDDGEKAIFNKFEIPAETSQDALKKAVSLLALACVILRKYAPKGKRNEYIKLVIATLWYHKIDRTDCERIIEVVATAVGDDVKERLGRIKGIYEDDNSTQFQGLPTLAADYDFSEKQVTHVKKILYAITGRDALPDYTNTFVDRIAYMMKQKMYYDLEDKEMYEGESIDVKYAKFFKNGKYTPLKFWKQHPDSKVCVNFTYKPNDKNRFVKVNKKLMINVYEPVGIKPDSTADTDLFDALVKHIIPHDAERKHFLDWFAYPLQYPGVKIRHAIILQSDEFQLGKGSLFDIHRDLLGHHNTNKIDLEQAINREKGFLVDKQTVLIDEAKAKGSWGEKSQFINTLKTLISEGTSGVRALYQGYKEQETCTNYWINTNYKDAFPLPQNEVRYWVYFSDAKRNEKLLTEFHKERLEGNLVAGVMAQLLDRDLSKFNPLGVAPWTKFRDLMHDLADKPVNDYIKESFDQGVYPFDRELITTTETFSWLKEKSRAVRVTREREIADAFTNIGGVRKRNCPVKGVGKSVNIWILRNHDKYKNMSAVELGKIYVGFHTESRTIDAK